MTPQSPTHPRSSATRFFKGAGTAAVVLGAIAFAVGPSAHRAEASGWDKMTKLTVNEPIQVSDTYLDAGTYVFKLADIGSSRHIVQIFNNDQTHIINTVMAIPNERLQPTGDSRFAFWETPPGNVRAMRAWFYPGDNFGQEFRYPKQLRQIAYASTPQLLTPPPQAEPFATRTEPQEPAVVPETSSVEAAPAPARQEPVEIAQATRPPAPEPVQIAQAQPVPAPQELPKTASPFTAVGLGGLTLLGLFGVLRFARVS